MAENYFPESYVYESREINDIREAISSLDPDLQEKLFATLQVTAATARALTLRAAHADGSPPLRTATALKHGWVIASDNVDKEFIEKTASTIGLDPEDEDSRSVVRGHLVAAYFMLHELLTRSH